MEEWGGARRVRGEHRGDEGEGEEARRKWKGKTEGERDRTATRLGGSALGSSRLVSAGGARTYQRPRAAVIAPTAQILQALGLSALHLLASPIV